MATLTIRIARERFRVFSASLSLALEVMQRQRTVAAATEASITLPDPDDGPLLACALAASADLPVTGDQALLEVACVGQMPIVSPRACWQRSFSHPPNRRGDAGGER